MTNSQGIEGVPVGAKVVRIGQTDPGDSIINSAGQIERLGHMTICKNFPIVVPDNPYNRFLHEVEEDIKKAGRERLGGNDYRVPREGEECWATFGATTWNGFCDGPRLILKPKTKKVLFETRIWNIGNEKIDMLTPEFAAHLVSAYPETYRIETRPA